MEALSYSTWEMNKGMPIPYIEAQQLVKDWTILLIHLKKKQNTQNFSVNTNYQIEINKHPSDKPKTTPDFLNVLTDA